MLQHLIYTPQTRLIHQTDARSDVQYNALWRQTHCLRASHITCMASQPSVTSERSLVKSEVESLRKEARIEQTDQSTSSPDSATDTSDSDRPQTSSQAITRGIEDLKSGQPSKAIERFQAALELPGNGYMRFAGTVREYRCPSDAEEQAALYNMACAYASLRQRESAIACLEGALEAGLSDFEAVRSDPDLDAVRGPELDKLLSKYDNLLAKVFKKRKDDEDKPWFLW